jgi:hypothetical protein
VTAAFIQITYLTEKWRKLHDDGWPRPFGDKKHAFGLGAVPAFLPTLILICVWGYLLIAWWGKEAHTAMEQPQGGTAANLRSSGRLTPHADLQRLNVPVK